MEPEVTKIKPRKEVVLHYEEILKLLKKHVADKAGSFLGLTYKQEDVENIICLDEYALIIPSEGIHFTIVESPIDYK